MLGQQTCLGNQILGLYLEGDKERLGDGVHIEVLKVVVMRNLVC
jgi:hypothetical protein